MTTLIKFVKNVTLKHSIIIKSDKLPEKYDHAETFILDSYPYFHYFN